MTSGRRHRELGRGERVVPGVWRLRLPLPWPGVPHCNAWALAAPDGLVLVDTGMHDEGSMEQLERARKEKDVALEEFIAEQERAFEEQEKQGLTKLQDRQKELRSKVGMHEKSL